MLSSLEGDDLGAYALHCVEWLEDTAGDVLGVLPSREIVLSEPEEDPGRAAKDWAVADSIRDELNELGVVVTDTEEGPVWDLV